MVQTAGALSPPFSCSPCFCWCSPSFEIAEYLFLSTLADLHQPQSHLKSYFFLLCVPERPGIPYPVCKQMSFSSIAIYFTFIPLNLFFQVLAPIFTLFWEVPYESLEWTCLAPNYKLLTLKLLHHPIPKQNLHHLSSKTDPLQAPHYMTHVGFPGPSSLTIGGSPGQPSSWVSGLCLWWGVGFMAFTAYNPGPVSENLSCLL